jgi:hypothetical protein
MRDPDTRAGTHDRLESGHETAGGVPFHKGISMPLVNNRLPIRKDKHPLAFEIASQRVLEMLGRPHRIAGRNSIASLEKS